MSLVSGSNSDTFQGKIRYIQTKEMYFLIKKAILKYPSVELSQAPQILAGRPLKSEPLLCSGHNQGSVL